MPPSTPQSLSAKAGKDSMEKETRLDVRCSRAEIGEWKKRAQEHELSLSAYARSCLNKGPAVSRVVKVDPALIRQIAAIGNNLNQLTRRVNTSLRSPDRVVILQVLEAIKGDLEKILGILERERC